jgi:peptidoglycan hydrolase CwlO-like protein
MRKPKIKIGFISTNWRTKALTLAVASILVGGSSFAAIARADTLQQQIDTLNAQNNSAQQTISDLQASASSYQDAVYQLESQISAIQAAIVANQASQAQLETEIAADQAQITLEKSQLAATIQAMYIDGQTSTIEELATSKNLNDYIDKQEYRTVVQNKLDDTINQIVALQAKQQADKLQIDQSLQTESTQQSQLTSDQTQQNQLIALNEGQQDQYNQQIKNNSSQISKLKAEQAAANASIARAAHVVGASGGSGGACDIGQGNGGYPLAWCNDAQDSTLDANGIEVRECTSYAFWYFTSVEGQTGFSVSGNAGWWYLTSNYPAVTWTGSNVKVGALGIEPSSSLNAPVPSLHGGYYGHVMIVQALPGQTYGGQYVPDGYVLVSSMNEDEAGHFMYNLWPVNYLMFINPR